MIINTVALLDKKTTSTIQEVMNDLADLTNNDRAIRFPPHFTLRFRYEVYDNKFEQLCESIRQCVQETNLPINFTANKIKFTPWNAIWLSFDVTKEIQTLHEKIMLIGQEYRTDYIPEDLIDHPTIDNKQKKYVTEFGYHLAFEYFAPHITLAGGKIDESKMSVAKEYKYDLPIVGSIEKVGIYKMIDDSNWVLEKTLGNSN